MTVETPRQLYFPTDYDSIIHRISLIDPVKYSRTRNFTDGAVTYLSPYISRGVVSAKQIRDAITGINEEHSRKLFQELAWREFFQRVWQEKGHRIFGDLRQPQSDVTHYGMIESIVNASTGIEAIDQAIQTFYNTEYLHNHVRMYIASIACNIGRAHWLQPSRWMYAHLLDGDLASNTCSWQWVAGSFSNKKYYCNQENINHFTRSYQRNTFLDQPTEILANGPIPDSLSGSTDWSLPTQLATLPAPSIDITLPTLIYNSYNLDPLWRKSDKANRILLLEPSHFEKFPVTDNVFKFILALSKNISGIKVMVGEIPDLQKLYDTKLTSASLVSKEHPAFNNYPGLKDERDWMFPDVTGYFPSFSSFWKACTRTLVNKQ